MSDAPILSKYAQYLNKYKPDTQNTSVDYKKRLDDLKKQMVSPVSLPSQTQQSKPQTTVTLKQDLPAKTPSQIIFENQIQNDIKNIQKLQTQEQTKIQQQSAQQEIQLIQPKVQQYQPPVPQTYTQEPETPAHDLLPNDIKLQLQEQNLPKWYKKLNLSILQQPSLAQPKQSPKLPDQLLILEKQLVSESCQILIGAKQTNAIFVVSTDEQLGVQLDQSLSFQQQQAIKKILSQTITNRNSVVKAVLAYQSPILSQMTRKFGSLLYEAVVALDKSVLTCKQISENLFELEQNLAQITFTYQILSNLVGHLKDVQGAQLLFGIEKFYKDHAGLPHQKVISYLLFEIFKFYIENLLFKYLSEGVLPKDNSFVIEKNENQHNLDYFRVNSNKIDYLEPISEEILVLGRNQFILNQLKIKQEEDVDEPILIQLASNKLNLANLIRKLNLDNPSPLYQFVQLHTQQSQQQLLTVFYNNFKFKTTFNSIIKFFLFSPSDIYQIFLETAYLELEKPKDTTNLIRLNNLFKLSIQTSSLKFDENNENVNIQTSEYNFLQLFELVNEGKIISLAPEQTPKTLNSLQLNFKVSYPLNLIFNEQFFNIFNLIFRRFLRQKLVEIQLNQAWKRLMELKHAKKLQNFSILYKMLHKMQNFINVFNFNCNIVITTQIELFNAQLLQISSVDELQNILKQFSYMLLKKLKLTDSEPVKRTDRLFADCLVFCNFVEKNFTFKLKDIEREKAQFETQSLEFQRLIKQNLTALNKLESEFERKKTEWEGDNLNNE